jgi:3',5'-cyclic AMP phosphodiesterase CpdA
MMTPLTVAQLTDVHLGPIAGFGPRYWNAKRIAGYINWRRSRRAAFQRPTLDRIVADLKAREPDHIVVTGDLVNIGLPQELKAALAWLHGLGAPEHVTVIPGNHDIYCHLTNDVGTGRWSPYMSSNAQGSTYAGDATYPFVRIIGEVALIGVNSALPTPPLIAWGEVGAAQRDRLAAILGRLGLAGLFRLLLIHHPPLAGQSDRLRGLKDAAELECVLARHGAELVIHGHHHHNMFLQRQWANGVAAVVGAPSASLARPHRDEPLARYNSYRIEGGRPWTVTLLGRGLAEEGGDIVDLERRQVVVGAPPAGRRGDERS